MGRCLDTRLRAGDPRNSQLCTTSCCRWESTASACRAPDASILYARRFPAPVADAPTAMGQPESRIGAASAMIGRRWPTASAGAAATARPTMPDFVTQSQPELSNFKLTKTQHFLLGPVGRRQLPIRLGQAAAAGNDADGRGDDACGAANRRLGRASFRESRPASSRRTRRSTTGHSTSAWTTAKSRPGDLTALMALPWQADFWDCRDGWWPAQRPDDVRRFSGVRQIGCQWHRGATSYQEDGATTSAKLGFITAQNGCRGQGRLRRGPARGERGRRMSGDTPLDLDVLVIGGGPAGSACAIRLARGGARVAIAEASEFSRFRIGETIAPSVRPVLAQLGIEGGDDATGRRHRPALPRRGGSRNRRRRPSMLNPHGRGWRVDRKSFDRMLFEQARKAGAIAFTRCRLVAGERRANVWTFVLRSPTGLVHGRAQWVVAATGRSASAPLAPSRSRLWLDRLFGIALIGDAGERTKVRAPAPATVEAAPAGWWYSVAIPDGRLLTVFFTDADLLPKGKRALGAFLHDQLAYSPLTRAGSGFAQAAHRTRLVDWVRCQIEHLPDGDLRWLDGGRRRADGFRPALRPGRRPSIVVRHGSGGLSAAARPSATSGAHEMGSERRPALQ